MNNEPEIKQTNNTSNEDPVFLCLKESLKIMERIQKDFEMSAVNNNRENEMKSFIVNISKESVMEYTHISEFEKRMINNQIIEASEQRLKNYSNLFNIINASLSDIKECLITYHKGKIFI